MKLVQSVLPVLIVALCTNTALAQQTSPNPGSAPNEEVDLPVNPIDQKALQDYVNQKQQEKEEEENNNNEEDEGDDPRDTPPPVIYGEELDSENDTIFYVLDISCSMDWDTRSYTSLDGKTKRGTRMDRAKAELARSIMGLAPNFKFNIISFDCSTRQWQREMQPADDANKSAGIAWVMAQDPIGATGTGPATALALSDKDNMMVVLLTDGAPNCPGLMSQHRTIISNANTQGATINVFGIAADGSYRAFCQSVASDSGGSYFDVP